MKTFVLTISALLVLTINLLAQDVTWPRKLTSEGSVITLYQPQVQQWDDYKKIDFRMAFSLVPYQGKEVVGVLYVLANTEANMETHRVVINNMTVKEVHFPSLDAKNAEKMEKIVRTFVTPERSQELSVEQVVACTPKKDQVPTVKVNNNPPVIFVSKTPTILLQLEGKPVKAAAGGEDLEFVINSNFPLFYDKIGKSYLLYEGKEWQKSVEPGGPWTFTSSVPKALVNLAKDTNWRNLKGAIPAVTKADSKMPKVFYSEKIAELILFEGEPAFKQITGTTLKFATNTGSDIFQCSADKKYYYLTSGRWFSSATLDGPWVYATDNLPKDFAKIPDDSPAASIMAFVPGTEQAKDAVMIAQIPVTIETDAKEAGKKVKVIYSGDPKFEPIEGSSLYYAVNTTEKVIKVSSNQYYCCYQGIWFLSSAPTGPWTTATTVPEAIYKMPASSPVYNVTYVTQTVTTTNVVVSTYTSGYTGVYVMGTPYGVVIVSGTGFYYPPYYYYPPHGYPVYYHYPVTYGCYAYHPYPYGGVAYHASYNPYTGVYGRSATAYGPYGSKTVSQGYNSRTGTYARGASVSTPYGSRSAGQAYNPYTGGSAATRQGSNGNAQWGATTVNNGHGQSATAAHVTTRQGSTTAVKTKNGDMYATSNGEVYKNTGSGWEDASKQNGSNSANKVNTQGTSQGQGQSGKAGASTQDVNTAGRNNAATTQQSPASTSSKASSSKPAPDTQELNREAQNRQRGNTQTQQFNTSSRPSGGGGGGRGRR